MSKTKENLKKLCTSVLLCALFVALCAGNVLAASNVYTFAVRSSAFCTTDKGEAKGPSVQMAMPITYVTGKAQPYVKITIDPNTAYQNVDMRVYWTKKNIFGVYDVKDDAILYQGQLGNPTKNQITSDFTKIELSSFSFSNSNYSGDTYFRFKCSGATTAMYFTFKGTFTNWEMK